MKKFCLTVLSLIALSVFAISPSWAGSNDKLINKLVEKNILTRSEAEELITQMQAEEEKKVVPASGFELPKWVENTNFKGDVRARYQHEDKTNDSKVDRNRGRVRLRFGVESKVNDQWMAGFGLATGSNDPRSTNQTLQDDFSTKDIRLDYAYAKYSPCKYSSLWLGKFKNPIWGTKDLLWDGDITPEGAAITFNYEASKNLGLFGTLGGFVLEEFSSKAHDPYMIVVQPGIKVKLPGSMYIKAAASYYEFQDVHGNDWSAGGAYGIGINSTDAAGSWEYDHDALAADLEFGITKIPGPIPYAAVFGQYVQATNVDDKNIYGKKDDTGWLAGLKFGHKKVKELGDWQLKYNYRRLERDAWPDFFPDSDFYGGATNAKGHEAELVFGISKNVSLGLDYYNTKEIRKSAADDKDQQILQADLVVKF
ncbi:MAG: putative porin [Pseudomonadota bacterium]